MGVSRTSRSLSQRQRNFANIYTHTGLARILKQGKINTEIDPKWQKLVNCRKFINAKNLEIWEGPVS